MAQRLRSKSDEDYKKAIGMPDEADRKNMQTAIHNFAKKKFKECEVYESTCSSDTCKHLPTVTGAQWINLCVKASKRQLQTDSAMNEFGMKNKDMESRIATSMPPPLWAVLSDTMPTVFSGKDQSHMDWFIKHFGKVFQVAQKY